MNTILRQGMSWLPSLAALAVLGNSPSVLAQTLDSSSNSQPVSEAAATVASPNQSSAEVNNQAGVSNSAQLQQFPNTAAQENASRISTPIPGTAATLSAALTSNYPEPTAQQPNSQPSTPKVAQADIDPGRATRGGKSYLGVGGNIGLSGDSPLGDGNFAVISKVGLTNNFSLRPSAVIGDNTVILAPITYDFSFQQVADPFNEPLPIAPYLGVGAAFKLGDNSKTAFLVTGGIDVPLNSRFTATAAVNAGFFDKTDVGLLLGVGYNFGSY